MPAGDAIVRVADGHERLTVEQIDAAVPAGKSRTLLERALRVPTLSEGWKSSFRELLAKGDEPPAPAWLGFRPLRVPEIRGGRSSRGARERSPRPLLQLARPATRPKSSGGSTSPCSSRPASQPTPITTSAGPDGFMRAIAAAVTARRVPPERVATEAFSAIAVHASGIVKAGVRAPPPPRRTTWQWPGSLVRAQQRHSARAGRER